MKIVFIGTYPPRRCGIGTFTQNLLKNIVNNTEHKSISQDNIVIAVNDDQSEYPNEVKFTVRQHHLQDYVKAAKFINFSNVGVCILQHEFGIFGGNDGVYILPLLHRLEIPLIVTFHTVLNAPSYMQRLIVEEIGRKAVRIIVMSKLAIKFLKEIYKIPTEKIALIEHGVPEFDVISRKNSKEKHGFENKKILFTFGLLSRNKGIETVINALPRIVEKHPNILYVILGATHPNVLKQSGEEYRDYLKCLVKTNDLEKNVYFNNEFVSETKLAEYLSATDIYITPYLNEAQISSGTLSYAIGAGCAVVSTPYWHAQELLDNNRGSLFGFKNSEQLSDILTELLEDENKLTLFREKTSDYGKKLLWPKIGKLYFHVAEHVLENWEKGHEPPGQQIDLHLLPSYDLSHFTRLTDDTGIIQHAKYNIPNLKEGYCIDDNSRALLMALMAYRLNKDKEVLTQISVFLNFIYYMQLENGNFRNFLSFGRKFLDKSGSEDSFGRTIWALGYLIRFAPNESFKQIGWEIFYKSVMYSDRLKSIRGSANTIIGIYHYLKENPNYEGIIILINKLVLNIVESYEKHSSPDWQWFEDEMTYDNGILPLALFSAYEITGEVKILKIAEETSTFLESLTYKNGYFAPIGNKNWYKQGNIIPEFDQQPIDVMAMILLYHQMFEIKKDGKYIDKLFACYLWFLGENSLRLTVYDHETKGCCDGLDENGLNRNQGAESTIAYWISHLTVLAAHEEKN